VLEMINFEVEKASLAYKYLYYLCII